MHNYQNNQQNHPQINPYPQYDLVFNTTNHQPRHPFLPNQTNSRPPPILKQMQPAQIKFVFSQLEQIKQTAAQKQYNSQQIWNFTPQQVQQYFFNYPIDSRANISLQDLLNSNSVRIIRDLNRVYFGQVQQGNSNKKHGRGIFIHRDGRIYEGYFYEGEKQGIGYQIYENGNVFIGEFQKNKKHGHGTMHWFNFSTAESYQYYDGQWWAGVPQGTGYHQRGNGDIYEGQFKNGLKHGQGLQYFHNGDCYIGNYANGFPDGYGEYTWSDGSNYKGDFKQGLRSGFGTWKKFVAGGKRNQYYKGHYLLDQRSGYGIYKWSSSNYYKGNFFEDQRHGYGQLYHNNQLIYQGMWQNGERAQHLNNSKNMPQLKFSSDPRQPNLFPPVPQKYILVPMQMKPNSGDDYPLSYNRFVPVLPRIPQGNTEDPHIIIKQKSKSIKLNPANNINNNKAINQKHNISTNNQHLSQRSISIQGSNNNRGVLNRQQSTLLPQNQRYNEAYIRRQY